MEVGHEAAEAGTRYPDKIELSQLIRGEIPRVYVSHGNLIEVTN